MARTYDHSDYQMDEYEKEKARHRGNESISFDVFQNKVVELKNEKVLCVYVDDFFEDENMAHIFAQAEGYATTQAYLEKYYHDLLAGTPDYYELEAEAIAHYEKLIEEYAQRFDIYSPYESADQRREAASSALAGTVIKIPLGEGILDFCYADFEAAFDKNRAFYDLFSNEVWSALRKSKGILSKEKVVEIKRKSDDVIETYLRYNDAVTVLGDVMERSLYSLINPPMLLNQDRQAYTRYKNYLMGLQRELLGLLEFCYDETFYPKLLSPLTPAQRFNLYSRVSHTQSSFERKELYQLGTILSAPFMPVINSELPNQPLKIADIDEESASDFAKRYNLEVNLAKMLLTLPSFHAQYYECATVYDMLMLEFTKMLEHQIRFRKCKNCGRYFIMKGNYQTDYCDRIPEGETKNCQTIAALKNYKEKVSDNTAWKLYNKYYKRYFARMKAGNISSDAFKQWQYKATAMRDDCVVGQVSEQELEDFLFGSFVNRKK